MEPLDPAERIWEDDDGSLWTDFPPPHGFQGREIGVFDGCNYYARTLTQAEQEALDRADKEEVEQDHARRDRFLRLFGRRTF